MESEILFELREITLDDAKLLFDWANDPAMRANSFHQKKIEWNKHITWLKDKLDSKSSKIFIASFNGNDIGQIRFDRKENKAIIDFYITEEFRGKGLGSSMLLKGEKKITNYWKDIVDIVGEVKKNNLSSNKAFIKAGFQENESGDIFIYTKKVNKL
ncbi:MAG: hypothetical protein STSR0008_12280 [Ignavibacterium sp.]